MSDYGPKADGVLFPHQQQHDKQPNFRGNIDLSRAQLHKLVDLAKESDQNTFRVLIGAWKRVSEKGDPYIYLQTEVQLPSAKEERQFRPKPAAQEEKDPWG